MLNRGRNQNTNDVATVTTHTINSVTATPISFANAKRIAFSACLDAGSTDVDVFIRLYPAADDNIPRGEVLSRFTFGNSNLFRPCWFMQPDNTYTGEISAITDIGEVDIHVTEY